MFVSWNWLIHDFHTLPRFVARAFRLNELPETPAPEGLISLRLVFHVLHIHVARISAAAATLRQISLSMGFLSAILHGARITLATAWCHCATWFSLLLLIGLGCVLGKTDAWECEAKSEHKAKRKTFEVLHFYSP
jgi:hypothetical protein